MHASLPQLVYIESKFAPKLCILHIAYYTVVDPTSFLLKRFIVQASFNSCSIGRCLFLYGGSIAAHACAGMFQALVNVLIVAPESLLGLVDASLRMSHEHALKFICLREDWRTARVNGASLASVLSSDI